MSSLFGIPITNTSWRDLGNNIRKKYPDLHFSASELNKVMSPIYQYNDRNHVKSLQTFDKLYTYFFDVCKSKETENKNICIKSLYVNLYNILDKFLSSGRNKKFENINKKSFEKIMYFYIENLKNFKNYKNYEDFANDIEHKLSEINDRNLENFIDKFPTLPSPAPREIKIKSDDKERIKNITDSLTSKLFEMYTNKYTKNFGKYNYDKLVNLVTYYYNDNQSDNDILTNIINYLASENLDKGDIILPNSIENSKNLNPEKKDYYY